MLLFRSPSSLLAVMAVFATGFGIPGFPPLGARPAAATEPIPSLRELATRATRGEVAARFELGMRLKRGINTPPDPAAALDHLCEAARAGHAGAAGTLGEMYQSGDGLPVDERQAAAWFTKALAAGHPEAAAQLASLPGGAPEEAACNGRELAEREYRPPRRLLLMIGRLAPRYGLDPDFVLAVVAVESAFRTDAVSPSQARGLMQLTDATARRFGVADPLDAEQNLRGGMRFLAALVDRYDGDLGLVLAAYNAGPGAVAKHGGIPPFPETRAYIAKVARYFPLDRGQPALLSPDVQVAEAEAGGTAVVPVDRRGPSGTTPGAE